MLTGIGLDKKSTAGGYPGPNLYVPPIPDCPNSITMPIDSNIQALLQSIYENTTPSYERTTIIDQSLRTTSPLSQDWANFVDSPASEYGSNRSVATDNGLFEFKEEATLINEESEAEREKKKKKRQNKNKNRRENVKARKAEAIEKGDILSPFMQCLGWLTGNPSTNFGS